MQSQPGSRVASLAVRVGEQVLARRTATDREREQNQKAEDMLLRSLRRVVQRAAAPRCLGGGCARRALATHVLNVPAMGDSITEGTVASVEKAVGDAVAVVGG